MDDPERIVTLRRYPDEMLAEMARTALESHGITAMVSRDDCGGMEPQLNMVRGVRLIVNQGNAEAALEILDKDDSLTPAGGEDGTT